MEHYYIGVDVGGTKIAFGLFDKEHRLITRSRIPSDREIDGPKLSALLLRQCDLLLETANVPKAQLSGIGVAMPSYILQKEGRILKTSNLPNIRDFPMRDYLSCRTAAEVRLENDGNAAALAEFHQGAGRGFEDMLYCPVSTGCSSAIVINGHIFHGSYGWAGESGHALITPGDGPYCGCENRGCFMSHISGYMIVQRVIQRIQDGTPTELSDMVKGDLSKLTAEHILRGAQAGDALALWAVDHMAHYMALWLFDLYQILNINCFVFGGGLVHFGPLLFDKAFEEFQRYNKNDLPVYFRFAQLGGDAGIIGASRLFS